VKNQLANYSADALIQAEVLMKYSGYLEKEKLLVDKMNRLEDFKIKDDFDFLSVKSISLEAREKLNKQRPQTIGQAARISGISPSDVSILMVHLGR
jgi:tRNA uridine 5-carboxymethylaminomethyl modification enzyme